MSHLADSQILRKVLYFTFNIPSLPLMTSCWILNKNLASFYKVRNFASKVVLTATNKWWSFESPLKKQDHQRWGYSTVIHLEKTIYLAIWKDLNKEKRKEQ